MRWDNQERVIQKETYETSFLDEYCF